jgi:tetratricopeptide (TPR) repeat protein
MIPSKSVARKFGVKLLVAVAIAASSTWAAAAEKAEKESNEPKITTKALAEPLKKAQEALQQKQWDVAQQEIQKAQAVEKKTPYESFKIDEFQSYVYIQQKKFAEAAPIFERMLNSGQVPPDQVDGYVKTVSQLYFQVKEYRKAADWAQKWLEKSPNDENMSVLLGQAYYLLEDYKNAATILMGVVTNAERNGKMPEENWIQIVLSSQFKQDNREGITQALKKMVRYHPKPEYWENLLDLYTRKDHGDRVTLGFYRLMMETGTLKRAGDYVEMAQLALLDAGLPGEAQQVMEKGVENGTLKSADKTEQGRFDRLLGDAKRQSTTDRAALPQLAKEAEKSPKGQADVALGQAYISYGQYAEAITAIERGIKKGGVTDADEAQVSLGLAYLKKGDRDKARETFKVVKPESKWGDLAELWSIRTQTAT